MMSNAGGAWDNSKKYIEIEGQVPSGKNEADYLDKEGRPLYIKKEEGGFLIIPKHTDHHDACVVGDTVGDPFKDTSGAPQLYYSHVCSTGTVLSPIGRRCIHAFCFSRRDNCAAEHCLCTTTHHGCSGAARSRAVCPRPARTRAPAGPALNILIKLMSMISLTIAPLLRNNTTYYEFGYGLIPIGLMFLVAIFAHYYAGGIMDDPDVGGDAPREEAVVRSPGLSAVRAQGRTPSPKSLHCVTKDDDEIDT